MIPGCCLWFPRRPCRFMVPAYGFRENKYFHNPVFYTIIK
ncbi:hypothetical protein CLOBOL_05796 [Enterocloster bolteae ATCC BAA-613]|uniref:Uncharacterized protein n=1 Tax=Enterocloster bolteae (strain ATCC BAA-613 / DSM 15670 / CCUG 46953 / JCM 12243 / WAL 16351) TaxID=411902 RepID=A8S0X2_ENTBW|nr:hypothetical protein CLOBOL_05796 [Enterocloster bolteae ATCC BAA-613]